MRGVVIEGTRTSVGRQDPRMGAALALKLEAACHAKRFNICPYCLADHRAGIYRTIQFACQHSAYQPIMKLLLFFEA